MSAADRRHVGGRLFGSLLRFVLVSLAIEVRLNEEFMVGVRKTAFLTTTGLQVKQSRFTVEVHQVNAGLIDDWNGKHPKRAVRVGDYLVEVNGVRGPTAQEMLETFQRQLNLNLVFVRKA